MREEGYYWVKRRGIWIVAKWEAEKMWFIIGSLPYYYDYSFEEIDEKRLTRNGKG